MDALHYDFSAYAATDKGAQYRSQSQETRSTSGSDVFPGHRVSESSVNSSVESRHQSISSLESIDAAFDARSFVQYHGAGIERRYDIDMNVIASGGYGKVFKAEDRQCKGRVVAIKKVLGLDETTASKYMKEAKIMQELDHPGICKLFEVYQDDDVLYLVLEYLEGGELFDKIVSEEKMTEQQIADIIKQVLCALKYAHSCGMAHRDLKPENICFCNKETSQVKVIDWGLSSDFCKGKMKSSVGSPTYSGPEVFNAQGEFAYTSACDLWSVGVLTYVMLCGKPPFWGSPRAQYAKMMEETYPMDDALWQRVSDGAKDFIRRLLKSNPQERMTCTEALSHPFLASDPEDKVEKAEMEVILSNMVSFSKASRFFSLLMVSAARQLDQSNVNIIRKVFNELDSNHDGVLEFSEVHSAFQAFFGEGSGEVCRCQEIFHKLDLDGSGRITYTEFCAATMSDDVRMQERVLWLAFKAFDAHGDHERISEDEIEHLLANADSSESVPKSVCENVAREVMAAYDHNADGGIDFEEFKCMMQSFAKPETVPQAFNYFQKNSKDFGYHSSEHHSSRAATSVQQPPLDTTEVAATDHYEAAHTPAPARRSSWTRSLVQILQQVRTSRFHSQPQKLSL